MTNKIVWEKWIDPFLTNIDEIDVSDDFNEDEDNDSYSQVEGYNRVGKVAKKSYSGPVMVGPMGIIPINEHNSPSKVYCFWMMHTNFNISPDVARVISETPGVEALDIFTRYRARIAVGKAFLDTDKDPYGKEVLLAIERRLCPKEKKVVKQEGKAVSDKLILLKKHLTKKYKHWVIFTLPDGTLETKGATTVDELREEADSRGATATSWE